MRSKFVIALSLAQALAGCAEETPSQPAGSATTYLRAAAPSYPVAAPATTAPVIQPEPPVETIQMPQMEMEPPSPLPSGTGDSGEMQVEPPGGGVGGIDIDRFDRDRIEEFHPVGRY